MSEFTPRILCLSFHTPPAVRPQSILIGKMIPEWIRLDVKPVIVSYAGEDWKIDLPRYRLPIFKPNKFLVRIPGFRRLAEYFYYQQMVVNCIKIIEKHDLNLIFSFANPQTSNIIATKIKNELNIKVVCHFSDPWYDNEYGTVSTRQARRILKQERAVITASDKVVFVSDQLKDLVMKKYPDQQSKAVVIPHCFDQALYPETKQTDKKKFIISHIGAFYDQRNPEILFQVVKKLIDRDQKLTEKIKLQLVGGVNAYAGYTEEKIRTLLKTYHLTSLAEILPTVSFAESLKLMKEADCLVVIDANFSSSPFLPSKVVDYAGSEQPILGITPAGSATMKFLKRLGHGVFTYDQSDGMVRYLADLISGAKIPNSNHAFLEQFDVKQTSQKLINLFKQVV